MTRRIVLTDAAKADIESAHRWYAELDTALGAAFLAELKFRLDRIAPAPQRFPIVHRSLRKALLRRFPYAVYFRDRGDWIEVTACFHASRDPAGWRVRS